MLIGANCVLARPAKLIRFGAAVHFGILGCLLIPPLNRCAEFLIQLSRRLGVENALLYAVDIWFVATPVAATLLYTKLPLEKKAGTEGHLLLFWWISLFAITAGALALGAAF